MNTKERNFFNCAELFWSRVARSGDDDCWEWQGAKNKAGYGKCNQFGTNGRTTHIGAHRLALIHSGVSVPDDMCVLHSCDNRPCCNPRHLRVGTRIENAQDRMQRNNGIVLNVEQALEIRRLLATGLRSVVIAQRFGVSKGIVNHIRRGTAWAHV